MILTGFQSTTSGAFPAGGRVRRAVGVVSGALLVLHGCGSIDAVAPLPHGAPPVAPPVSGSPRVSVLPRLVQLSPDTLAPGGVVVIEGEHLDAPLDSIHLSVGGIAVPVYRVTATRIEARVPTAGLPCAATASQPVALMVAGTTLLATVPVRWAHPLALKPGESANLLSAEAARCVELAVPTTQRARYVVAVVNTSEAETSSDAFELRGTGLGPIAGALSAVHSHGTVGGTAAEMPSMLRLPMAAESRHDAWLDAQRNMVARAGSATRWWGAARAAGATHGTMEAPAMMAPASALKAGDVVTMTAPFNSCTAGAQVTARVVYAGATSVVLEDVAAPQAATMDADYRAIGEEFDRVQYPLLRQNIGDPLAMNGAMHGDGRVTLLFTRFLNDSVPGVAGYVSACNFYPTRTFAASNEDEVIYGRVAMGAETPADWRRSMRSTVMHEAKHLASFAERLAGSTPFEESWLEESTARIAEELYSRTFASGGQWKGNTGFATTVRCEVYQCDDRPLIMWKHFSMLHQYLRGVETLSPLGASTPTDVTFYASGWSLVRWAADHYATSEGDWLKALVRGGVHTGLANLARRTGRPAGELLADWALANAVSDEPDFVPRRVQLTFPSWNVADVWSGLAGTFPGSFMRAPLRARVMSFGTFVLPVHQLRAFSSSYVQLHGAQAGAQLLELRGAGGRAAAPAGLRMAVVRLE